MLRLFGRLILLLVLAVVGGLVLLPFAVIEKTPVIAADVALNPPQIARARALLAEHNPNRLRDGDVRALELSVAEVSLVLNYLLDQLGGGASDVKLTERGLSARLTRTLPATPLGRYLNLEVVLDETPTLPAIDVLRCGRLRIPGLLANPIFNAAVDLAKAAAGLPASGSVLKHVSFADSGVTLQYQWDTQIASAVRKQLIPPEDEARLREFHLKLVAVVREHKRAMTLSELAAPLFALGVTRAAGGDPVADNRAALMVLSSYVTGQSLSALLPSAADWPAPARYTVRMHRRHDLAKHFLNSAALTATGGRTISKSLGLSKEIADSRGGSGFSFIDLLADEAGSRFGQRATESRVVAREIQQRAANAQQDIDWMPTPDGLQEQMSEAEFTQRFGGLAGAGYQQALAEIKRRIDAIALYR